MKSIVRALMAAAAATLLLAACNRATDTNPPQVSITTPEAGTTVTVGVAVEVAGTSNDDRLVRTVTVLAGDTELGELVPGEDGTWSLTWLPQEPGSVSLTAVATDLGSNETTSAAVPVEVVADATESGTISGTLSRAATLPEAEAHTAAAIEPAAINPGGLFISFGRQVPAVELGTQQQFLEMARAEGFVFAAGGDFEYQGHTFELVRSFPVGSGLAFYRVAGLDESATRELRAELQQSSVVAAVYPNWIMQSHATPEDELYPLQAWHYGQMNLPAAWDIEDGSSQPVQVAVLDTGSYPHPDLDWGVGVNMVGFYSGETDGLPFDDPTSLGSDHGTHVAGTIGAISNNNTGVAGVNWGLPPITPIKVLGPGGSGALVDVFEGIFWAIGAEFPEYEGHFNPAPARVINLSLGGAISEPCPADFDAIFQLAHQVAGTIAVVSAGNAGSPTDSYFPANCPSVITVGATGPTGARAGYSNYGAQVDLMAPGGDSTFPHPADPENPGLYAGVVSTIQGGYGLSQGTSMAAPHVAGAISLLLSHDPDLTLDEVRDRLHRASAPMTLAECAQATAGLEGLNMCGAGLLDAAALLQGSDLASPSAMIYAVPAGDDGEAQVTLSELGGLASLATFSTQGELADDGSFSFEFSELPPGDYRIIGVELRQSLEGVGMTDRYAVQYVQLEPGGSAELELETEPVWLLAN